MRVSLLITRYPRWAVPFAFFSMAIFRLPLWLNRKISFWRLMGSGKNGGFDLHPDFRQWAILIVQDPLSNESLTTPAHSTHTNAFGLTPSSFINSWIKFFKVKTTCFILEPIEGFGLWEGKEVFGKLPKQTSYEGKIAVLTRATIRFTKLKSFWKNVPVVNSKMKDAQGLLTSYGIGEWPFFKQATFSIWESKAAMKNFAYKMQEHKEVVRKTTSEGWYKEEMFVRFKVLED